METKPFFVCFIGIDGTGKTFLARNLVNRMSKEGMLVSYTWGGYEMLITRIGLELAKRILSSRKSLNGPREPQRKREFSFLSESVLSRDSIKGFYKYLVLLEYLPQILLKIKVKLFFKRSVLCDRYIYDAIVNMSASLNHSEGVFERNLKILRLFPKPNLIFLVDVEEEIAFDRKKDIPSINYLKRRRRLYKILARKIPVYILDGTRKPGDLESVVLRTIFSAFGSGFHG